MQCLTVPDGLSKGWYNPRNPSLWIANAGGKSKRAIGPPRSGRHGDRLKARDTRLNRSVAIKVSSAKFIGRFATEARAEAALNYPWVPVETQSRI